MGSHTYRRQLIVEIVEQQEKHAPSWLAMVVDAQSLDLDSYLRHLNVGDTHKTDEGVHETGQLSRNGTRNMCLI